VVAKFSPEFHRQTEGRRVDAVLGNALRSKVPRALGVNANVGLRSVFPAWTSQLAAVRLPEEHGWILFW
jgi:hypothetical protein